MNAPKPKSLNDILGPDKPDASISLPDGPMFVVSGKVQGLKTSPGKVNLLGALQNVAGVSGVAHALGGLHGGVANAAMLASYDGEDVEKFVCRIGDQDVLGNFENVSFANDDEVKVVATRVDKQTLFAHAVVRPRDGLLWMPHSINKGRWEVAKFSAKLVGSICLGSWLLVVSLFAMKSELRSELSWFLPVVGLIALVFGVVLCLLLYNSSAADGQYAERILKILGFKNPTEVNLSPFSLARTNPDKMAGGDYQIYRLRDALRAYGSLSKAPTPASDQDKTR